MTGRAKGGAARRRPKMKAKTVKAKDTSGEVTTAPATKKSVSPKISPGQKRKAESAAQQAAALSNGDDDNGKRSSKRARLQLIPYQSPESISKIIQITSGFSDSLLSNNSQSATTANSAKPAKNTKKLKKAAETVSPPPVVSQSKVLKPKAKVQKTVAAPSITAVKKKKASPKSKGGDADSKGKADMKKIMKGKISTPTLVKKAKKLSKKGLALAAVESNNVVSNKTIAIPLKKRALKKNAQLPGFDNDEILPPISTIKDDEKPGKRKQTKKVLDPKPNVTEYNEDPTFESRKPVPYVSTLAHSRLLIRAVQLNDNKLLESLIRDKKSICAFNVPRSLKINRDALSYALEKRNIEAIKLLVDEKLAENLAPFPDVILSDETTGHNSVMMFGHAMRAVTVGRGGKEGNNALLKDRNIYKDPDDTFRQNKVSCDMMMRSALSFGGPFAQIKEIAKIDPAQESYMMSRFLDNIVCAVRAGHNKLAGEMVQESIKQGGFGFNLLHQEVLLNTKEPLTPFKSVSVVKKSTQSDRITPIHCAAINPNPDYLIALLNSRPDYNILDFQQWSPIHYAAVCTGKGPLETLLSRGISTMQMNRAGETPLHLASSLGRIDNIKVILAHEASFENDAEGDKDIPKDIAGSLIQRITKTGQTALHRAAEAGHASAVQLLLNAGSDANKFTPARYDKLTPFMMAAQYGHLEVLKILIRHGVKVDTIDHKGRTALAHAVINGQAHVVSYLLRLGAKHLVKDTSGNTLVHYAAAYGWYFSLKLLMEAGCPPNEPNDWKMSPLAIAFMKGHMGLVEYILDQSGVDINSRINDTTGVTLLLQTTASKPTSEFLSRMKFLLDDQKADCNIADFEKNNALHYLVSTEYREKSQDSKYEKSEIQKYVFQATQLLWDKKCDPCALNYNNESPVSLAVKHGCFSLLNKFFDLSCPLPEDPDSEGNTILHLLVDQITIDQASSIYKRCAKDATRLQIMKRMAKAYNHAGYTPLLWLFYRLPSINDADRIKRVIDFLSFLTGTLESDVFAVDKKEKSGESVLHLAAGVTYTEEALKILLPFRPNLEALNYAMRTPLASAIANQKENAAKALLNTGANVNFKLENGESLLLLQAVKQTVSFNLIPLMIEKGANIHEVNKHTKNSILHYIARKPHLPSAVESVKALIQRKININAVNKDGRTALHLAVNFRGGETDASYDIEDLLIESGAKLNIRDIRKRLPLHMAFVKINKHTDKTFMDPIELVTTLVRAMKDSLPNFAEEIIAPDVFGCTPLHYGAYRGATISCSYLIMEMKGNVDIVDKSGNTPFGLAVLNGHEGCALQFQQQGANYSAILNTNPPREVEEEKEKPWEWKFIEQLGEEKNRKKTERERYPILQEVVRKDWQGILHLMLEKLNNSGAGASLAISAAMNTGRLKLTRKLVNRAKPTELATKGGETLLHILAKSSETDNSEWELLEKIVSTLVAKGVAHSALDKNQSTALIYAAANRNYNLCDILGEMSTVMNKHTTTFKFQDKFGRNPFSALFWNISDKTEFSKDLKLWAENLLAQGAIANSGCRYPIIVHPYPGVKYLTCETKINYSSHKYSPLMMAIIAGNYSVVKWLLTLKSTNIVDVNFQDDDGRTALMHAVRLNDIKMVQLILNPKIYDHTKDVTPWKRKSSKFHYRNHLSLDLHDRKGWTVVDHLIGVHDGSYYYSNSDAIVRVLYAAGAPITKKSGDGISPLTRAIQMKRVHLVDTMEELLGFSKDRRTKIAKVQEDLFTMDDVTTSQSPINDFSKDCQQMTEKLLEEDRLENEDSSENYFAVKPDVLITGEEKSGNYKVMEDPEQKIPFSCTMTKVDINYGVYGMYNFYKMQLVKQERGKQMILLFTRWGRVGDTGQYQKTPFASEEEAIKEFKKIFRAKSGNSWENLEAFTAIPKKYRLVNVDTKNMKKPNQVKVSFDKFKDPDDHKKSELVPSLLKLVKTLSLVHETQVDFSGFENEYQHSLPFGSLTYETLKKGEALLDKISDLIREKEKKASAPGYTADKELDFMETVLKPCEEFYSLIPVYGFAKEKLTPMFTTHDLRAKHEIIYRLIHLEFANQLLLAAQYNLQTTNPFEYMYRCLNTKLEVLEENEEESQLILEYIHNTSKREDYEDEGRQPPKVMKIFRIERAGETERYKSCGIGNPWLLWHGSSTTNILSILHRGLKVTPLGTQINGDLFGKGIYFADMFSKSRKYCQSVGKSPNFIFLCEVALGKIHPVHLNWCQRSENKSLPSNCHSLKTVDSRWETDPASTITWKGRTVPIGRPVENILPKDHDHGLDCNEFIVFKEEQVNLRYLIQFTD